MTMPYKDPAEHIDDITIRRFRAQYRLSQNDLARLLGISRSTVQKLEEENAMVSRTIELAFLYVRDQFKIKDYEKADLAERNLNATTSRPTSQAKA
jgi:DNA-binding XRE family transcriptional regulator